MPIHFLYFSLFSLLLLEKIHRFLPWVQGYSTSFGIFSAEDLKRLLRNCFFFFFLRHMKLNALERLLFTWKTLLIQSNSPFCYHPEERSLNLSCVVLRSVSVFWLCSKPTHKISWCHNPAQHTINTSASYQDTMRLSLMSLCMKIFTQSPIQLNCFLIHFGFYCKIVLC